MLQAPYHPEKKPAFDLSSQQSAAAWVGLMASRGAPPTAAAELAYKSQLDRQRYHRY